MNNARRGIRSLRHPLRVSPERLEMRVALAAHGLYPSETTVAAGDPVSGLELESGLQAEPPAGRATSKVVANNVDGEATEDLVGFAADGRLQVALSDDGFLFEDWGQFSTAVTWEDMLVGDITGDGRDDVVARANGQWWVARSTGTGFRNEYWGSWSDAVTWDDVQLADVNGDGKSDIVGRTDGEWWVAKSSDTFFLTEYWGKWSNTVHWSDVAVGDFDGDGMDDIAGRSSGQWWVSKSQGTFFSIEYFGSWSDSVTWEDVSIADFDGDGRSDLAGRTSGEWWVSRSQGDNFLTEFWVAWSDGLAWEDVLIADVNGDGQDDILGRAGGDWWVSRSIASHFQTELWGSWSDAVVWEDVAVIDTNADGLDDVVGRTSNTWWASQSTGSQFSTINFGTSPDSITWTTAHTGNVRPRPTLSVSFTDATLPEGAGDGATTATVAHGLSPLGFDIIVEIESDFTELGLPASVTIPGDETSVTVTVTVIDDLFLDGDQSVEVRARHPSFDSGVAVVVVTDNESLHIEIAEPVVAENVGSVVGTVSRTNVADHSSELVVSLSSSNENVAVVPQQITIPAGPAAPNPTALFAEDFEGTISAGWNAALLPDGDIETTTRIELVNSPVNTGNEALKVTVRPGDAVTQGDATEGKDRAELERFSFGNEGVDGSEQWYAWSVFVPEEDTYVSSQDSFVILGQWHQSLEGITEEELALGLGTPPISMNYLSDGADAAAMSLSYGLGVPKQLLRAEIEKGAWVDWVVHVGWSRGPDGFVEAWVNGEALTNEEGTATRLYGENVVTQNDRPNSFKLGIYRGANLTEDMSVYFDSVSIGDEPPGAPVNFDITIPDDDLVDGTQVVDIVATAPSFSTAVKTLTVNDDEV